MAAEVMTEKMSHSRLGWSEWLKIGAKAAVLSVVSVLAVQAAALALWPDLAAFKPLDSYTRSALFTLVPAIGATAVFAWMAAKLSQPVKKFVILSVVVLLLSLIPDYALPLPGKTLLGSSAAAFMHLIAGIVTVAAIVGSYRQQKV